MYSASDFCVIAAIDNPAILDACLRRSPDIADGALPLITVIDARNMGEALNSGLAQTERRICLFAHQDVYFPRGWLDRAIVSLNQLTEQHPEWLAAGPYGVEANGKHVGRVWDTSLSRELGSSGFAPTPVASFDELLLILRRDEPYQFDADLPHFHMYGTDLAQTAWDMGRSAWVVELPVVHNSRPVVSLEGGYTDAYRYLRRKWRKKLPITTTVCTVTYNPYSLWRENRRLRLRKRVRRELLADAAEISRRLGYE